MIIDNIDFEDVRNHLRLRKELSLLHKMRKHFHRTTLMEWLEEIGVYDEPLGEEPTGYESDVGNHVINILLFLGFIKTHNKMEDFYEIL